MMKIENTLVKNVSRSFYLTLRLLPSSIRNVISHGYLLARVSDTISDTSSISIDTRLSILNLYSKGIKAKRYSSSLEVLLKNHFNNHEHTGERKLVQEVKMILESINYFSDKEQKSLLDVSSRIIQGQQWDLDHFNPKNLDQSLTNSQLDRYTYLVAGCVGEFWTDILYQYEFITRDQRSHMEKLGIAYGKGLQLTNILRDIPQDFKNDRIYIPGSYQSSLDDVLLQSNSLFEKTRAYLDCGLRYAQNLPRGKLKLATSLPAQLAYQTLNLLQDSSNDERHNKVKISRKCVKEEFYKGIWLALKPKKLS